MRRAQAKAGPKNAARRPFGQDAVSEMLRLVAAGCLLVQCNSFVAPRSAVCSSTQAVQLQKASLGQRSSACVLHAESADAAAFNVHGSAPDGWIETP
jgi:hypothetical protein